MELVIVVICILAWMKFFQAMSYALGNEDAFKQDHIGTLVFFLFPIAKALGVEVAQEPAYWWVVVIYLSVFLPLAVGALIGTVIREVKK